MPIIFIDNKPYEVKEGQNLLHASISHGLDLPYFCWHPALGSIGACRQCAVQHFKDENDTTGRTVMACMTPVSKDMRCSLKHPIATDFRARVIEWMMTNHPHDCPVCDEGGECHLQDMTVMTKHNYRRFRFAKRTFKNQYLGPFINHEMNRCITCYRCVRYYQGVAHGDDLAAFSLSNKVYFGRHEDGTLENEFSGNLVEICPTGVFTDKPYKETYTRKWDLQTAPSVCQLCSLGCNITPGERYGSIRRVQNRYNPFVNGYFLCDRGRFGHSFVNSDERITTSAPLDSFKSTDKIIGVGSARTSLENNFALRKSVGEENFYLGLNKEELKILKKVAHILEDGPAKSASLKDVEDADAILILGEDIINTAPMLALAIRKSSYERDQKLAHENGIATWQDQAVRNIAQNIKAPLITANAYKTKLDNIAQTSHYDTPRGLEKLGFEVAEKIRNNTQGQASIADEIAQFLSTHKKPVIISGTSLQSLSLIEACANISWALVEKGIDARLCFALPEANSLGLALLGDKSLDDLLIRIKNDHVDGLIILENDISKRLSTNDFKEVLSVKNVIALDYLKNATTERAQTLASLPFSEITGSFINNEGRAQRFYSVFVPKHGIDETWRTIGNLFQKNWRTLDYLSQEMFEEIKALKPWQDHLAKASFRILEQKIPRQTQEWSGRTAINANVNISEQAPPKDPNSPLSYSMEGFTGHPPALLTPFFWAPGWNSVQAINKYLTDVDGDYKNDHVGFRLFLGNPEKKPQFFALAQEEEPISKNSYRVIPKYFIFGSEERAGYSKAISERIPKLTQVTLSKMDAERLNVKQGMPINVFLHERKLALLVVIDESLNEGYVLLPRLYDLAFWLPKTCELSVMETQT